MLWWGGWVDNGPIISSLQLESSWDVVQILHGGSRVNSLAIV